MAQIGTQPARFAPSDDPRVANTVDKVTALLDSGGWNIATRAEVQAAVQLIGQLPAHQADSVIDQLQAGGQLVVFAQEVMDASVFGPGLTVDQRRDAFRVLAQRLDGPSLASFTKALAMTDVKSGGHDVVVEFGGAVARHASISARIDYVDQLAASTTDMPSFHRGAFNGQRVIGDAEARAVAEVVSSLQNNPAATRRAFESLDAAPGALDATFRASLDMTQHWGPIRGWHTQTADKALFRGLTQAAANMEAATINTPLEGSTRALGDKVFASATRSIDPAMIEVTDIVERITPMSPRVSEMAQLSTAVYDKSLETVGNYTKLHETALIAHGIAPELLSQPGIGFEAALYKRVDGEMVLAFRGTDNWNPMAKGDADDNLLQGLGHQADQYEAAVIVARTVQRTLGDTPFTITGHSLGGGLAATASGVTGQEAYTFNAAGISEGTHSRYNLDFTPGQVTNSYTTGDILSFVNGARVELRLPGPNIELANLPPSVGEQNALGNPLWSAYLQDGFSSFSILQKIGAGQQGVDQHLMDEVNRHIRHP